MTKEAKHLNEDLSNLAANILGRKEDKGTFKLFSKLTPPPTPHLTLTHLHIFLTLAQLSIPRPVSGSNRFTTRLALSSGIATPYHFSLLTHGMPHTTSKGEEFLKRLWATDAIDKSHPLSPDDLARFTRAFDLCRRPRDARAFLLTPDDAGPEQTWSTDASLEGLGGANFSTTKPLLWTFKISDISPDVLKLLPRRKGETNDLVIFIIPVPFP